MTNHTPYADAALLDTLGDAMEAHLEPLIPQVFSGAARDSDSDSFVALEWELADGRRVRVELTIEDADEED